MLSPREVNFIIEQLRYNKLQYLKEEKKFCLCENIDGYQKNVYVPTVKLFDDVLEKLERGRSGIDCT